MVDIFDKSKHASVGDPPSAGDGSRYEGFHQPKEWSDFKVNYVIQIEKKMIISDMVL